MFFATYQSYGEVVERLLDAKAYLRAKENESHAWEPIHAAADNANIVRLLMNAGAEINARTASNYTPLILAVKWIREASVQELLKHQPDLNCTADNEGLFSLPTATGNTRLIFCLLDAGMNHCRQVMAANSLSLHIWVKANHVKLLERLPLYSFPIEQQDRFGRTPLNCIDSRTEIAIFRFFLNRGAFVNTLDDYHETPLIKMVFSNEVQKYSARRFYKGKAGRWKVLHHLLNGKCHAPLIWHRAELKIG